MKNFSAKNAEFETLKINNEAAISSADLGTAPNQIPLNKDLGSLAYQDAVNLDDVSADMLELRAIAAEISDSAVDVFVYDTSRDSDGGAWRKRTQHTSWYNEELNTATRGGRREFPAVAVIVAETDKVTIYDGDDPDMGMWMVFTSKGFGIFNNNNTGHTMLSVTALNGIVCGGANMYTCVSIVNFIADTVFKQSVSTDVYAGSYFRGLYKGDISQRESGIGFDGSLHGYSEWVVANIGNDVAMTVLPNAPIDEDTGLPVPTIAVATNGGVSVIKDDGTVVDIICGNTNFVNSYHVIFDQSNRLFLSLDGQGNSRRIWGLNNIPAADLVITTDINEKQNGDIFIADDNGFGSGKDMFLFNESNPQATEFAPDNSIGTNKNLFKTYINKEDSTKSLYNYTTSKYNTGWMPGDIKLATLSDTTVETIDGRPQEELITNGGFSTNSDWVMAENISISDSKLNFNGAASNAAANQVVDTEIGRTYVATYDVTSYTEGEARLYARDYGGTWLTGYGTRSSTGKVTHTFTAISSRTTIYVYAFGLSSTWSADNVSVRATTELVTNGDFSTDSYWTKGTGWTISGGVAANDGSSTTDSFLSQEVYLEAGTRYALTASCVSHDAGLFSITYNFDDLSGDAASVTAGGATNMGNAGDQGYREFFANTSGYLRVIISSGAGAAVGSIDNVSMLPIAVEDRSVNNNDLQIVGAINKTPVAPGADLVAYSGFSENNYLVQPYNEDLNFGSGDYCFMLWQKGTDSVGTFVTIHDNSSVDPGDALWIGQYSANTIWFSEAQSGVDLGYMGSSIPNAPSIDDNVWNFWCFIKRSGNLEFWHNGMFIESRLGHPNLSIPSGKLFIGNDGVANNGQFYNPGELALLRISKTAPTAERIAKIYRDEKVLFTDGAQATLYGSSDAVTALAYDEKTELLHVGTASGRSDFSGLRRINNTTTAITTSISAHNNLIAEQ
jgi:hypothetical protein